ncbi:NmrA family transcriptional regulator [Secundilactobacillus pentosiphilus]|uniref:NmrA family transcriptional regulator n=1 Tax=Secundilactobacillus pentosiphilus TaxID=1714682 RepID=A0A1Z5IMW1_9LACO|nr:NmrA family NAD(P)-binding protein [Secundilactobacillus pentosiphilus]GAX03084.1 NmrA family transcriptional regulator [Secundilactobacillus pentosiphilus]GAX05008.1 NmrA family transcriptional regulator [Secundilactobacillus pentosiphilus]
MITVTSAAGHAGSHVVKALVDAGFEVGAADINPAVKDLPGIKQAFVGDLTDITVIDEITKASDKIAYIPPLFSAEEGLIGKQMIDSSIKNGVSQFIFISVTHPILTTLLQHVEKRDTEEHLIYAGMSTQLPYTILQPMHYMHNFDPKRVHDTGKYENFYASDGKLCYVDPLDVGEVAAKVAKDPDTYNKATFELVGTKKTYTPQDLVDTYNKLTGEHAVATHIDLEKFLDENHINDLYMRQAFKHLSDTYSKWGLDGNPFVLKTLLGREPTTFEEYLKREIK